MRANKFFYRINNQLFFRDRHIEHVRRLHIYLSRTTGHLSSHFHTYAIHKRCFPDLEFFSHCCRGLNTYRDRVFAGVSHTEGTLLKITGLFGFRRLAIKRVKNGKKLERAVKTLAKVQNVKD
jgi:hypothetical protein